MTMAATESASPTLSATTTTLDSVSSPAGSVRSHQSNASAIGAPTHIAKITTTSHRRAAIAAVYHARNGRQSNLMG